MRCPCVSRSSTSYKLILLNFQFRNRRKVIYSPPMENTDRYDATYLSRSIGSDWIDMNAFSINPNLVVVDRNQPSLIKFLENEGLDVIPLELRHSKLLGGGPHCVTLDVRRNGKLQRYFDET